MWIKGNSVFSFDSVYLLKLETKNLRLEYFLLNIFAACDSVMPVIDYFKKKCSVYKIYKLLLNDATFSMFIFILVNELLHFKFLGSFQKILRISHQQRLFILTKLY